MKRFLATLLICCFVLAFSVPAYAVDWYTMTFGPSLPWASEPTTEWIGYGLTFEDVYWYNDAFDPFDQWGIANGPLGTGGNIGRVNFLTPTDSVYLDLINLSSRAKVEFFAADDSWIGSLTTTVSSLSTTIHYSNISYLKFYDGGGSVGISTLGYETAVPEPATMILLGTGLLGGAAAYRRRRKK